MLRRSVALWLGLVTLLSLCLGACAPSDTAANRASESNRASSGDAQRVVSLDYCADQFVLRFVPEQNIAAVSPDARKYFSYMRDTHPLIPSVRPTAEDVLALNPTRVVRSYGGGPGATAFFKKAGMDVVQLGYSSTLEDVRKNIIDVATRLGSAESGREVAFEFARRLADLNAQSGVPGTVVPGTVVPRTVVPRVLYTTPGGVTTGPGSLVHEMMVAAGMINYEQRSGWRDLPLEQLVYDRPDQLAKATFGEQDTHVDPWTRSRHPRARELSHSTPGVELEGAWTSCGAWFLIDAIEAMAEAGKQVSEVSGLD